MIRLRCQLRQLSSHKGVTLIEVLITIVIMAFGLIAVVLMQTISLKSNHEASQRSTANYLAEDIISRIGSIPLANIAGYDTTTSGPIGIVNPSLANVASNHNPSAVAAQCTIVAPCSLANKITRDLWEWKELLTGSSGLANANGCIQVTNNQIRIIISWDGIGKSKATSSTTSCGTGDSALKRRSLTIFTLH